MPWFLDNGCLRREDVLAQEKTEAMRCAFRPERNDVRRLSLALTRGRRQGDSRRSRKELKHGIGGE